MVWNAITSSDAISSARLFFRSSVGVSVGTNRLPANDTVAGRNGCKVFIT
jgi:hypothetical protein